MEQINTEKYQKCIKSSIGNILDSIDSLYFLLGILAIASLFLFDLTFTVILSLLIIDILISKWMAKSGPAGLGLETASLATILAGFHISPIVGGLVGALSVLLRMGVGLSGAFILWKVPGFALLGILSGTLVQNILPQAILVLVLMRISFIISSKFLENKRIGSKISFSITNVILVYFLSLRTTQYGLV